MIVLISGFSGAGKSVLVKSISKKFKLTYVFTSDILKQISAGVPLEKINYKNTKMNKGWYEKSNLNQLRTKNDNLDFILDNFLLKIINKEKNIVLDSWALPYISKKGIKIWLHADAKERAKRASLRNKTPYEETLKLLKKKDNFSKRHFKKIYGFSLGEDLSVFDYVVDTNNKSIKGVEKEVFNILESKK